MTSAFSLRAAAAAFSAAALFGLTACESGPAQPDPDSPEAEGEAPAQSEEIPENPMPEPEYDSDDTVALPVGLISPAGYDWEVYGEDADYAPETPHGRQVARTEQFGCQDYISVLETVPVVTDNPAEAALEYLLSLERTTHGSPAFRNPLAASGFEVTGVENTGSAVTVNLTGFANSSTSCQSWQLLKQIETTVRAASGNQQVEILLDGAPLAGQLGLEDPGPLTIHRLRD
ncbi:GerMN domain-containing protein [Nesterenkonia alkaliphila]|uniref:GerMN domain-containing protein n=1 Tax=Nesterenkonia alkaliphila TaxID=1463631 RepID=A0A7K1UI04_9MICC|nr:GerMN domain-containing protein [Nesterenkonia alkaliphila]MVT26079.1 hypothetical protein [Nesterenkonia alkaliphila]GFZ79437.1 hypothetical protein GCM10011359_04900 [Nesterenkonia alkaliphila]